MTWETKIFLFLLNVFVISVPLAIFEVHLEKNKGWRGAMPKDKWYGKKVGGKNPLMRFICWIVGVPYFSGYGVFLWFFALPVFLFLRLLRNVLLRRFFTLPLLLGFDNYFFLHNFWLSAAIFVAILAVEDFLWFVFNPYFPALQELLKGPSGKIWWHKRWLRIYNGYHLPFSYAISASLAIIFLFLS